MHDYHKSCFFIKKRDLYFCSVAQNLARGRMEEGRTAAQAIRSCEFLCVVKTDFLLQSAQTTMFTRGSWTPDGQYYLAPAAMNNGGPTVEVVKRSQWDTHCNDLVGHRKVC